MSNIEKRIKEARPNLSTVSPLVHKLCIGFVIINFAIGTYIFGIYPSPGNELPLFGNFLTFQAWAFIFWTLASAMTLGIVTNSWRFLKNTLLAGLSVKIFWALSLGVLASRGFPVMETLILWLFLAWVQAWTVVHFLPVIGWNGLDKKGRQ